METVPVSSNDDDIVIGTPSKITEFVKEQYSTKANWATSEHQLKI